MYFIDVQGTLISDLDKSPIAGSREFLAHLNATKTPFMIITNNTKHSSKEFYNYLQSVGLEFDFAHYLDPLMTLEHMVPKGRVAVYGSAEFVRLIAQMGYTLEYQNPSTVILSIKKDFNSDEFAQMIEAILGGAKLVGMHETSLYAKDTKRYPGVGALLKMLSYATSCSYSVVGKPSVAFYNESLARLRLQSPHARFEDVTIISDDLSGDLVGAKELGMQTYFVLSGKFKSASEVLPMIEKRLHPERIFANMQEILEQL